MFVMDLLKRCLDFPQRLAQNLVHDQSLIISKKMLQAKGSLREEVVQQAENPRDVSLSERLDHLVCRDSRFSCFG